MSLDLAIHNCFRLAKDRNWDKVYWAIDIHGVVIKPTWSKADISLEAYPNALEVLQQISKRPDIVLILYTCSWPEQINKYLEFFACHSIHFSYINGNPEVGNNAYGCYNRKLYFNVLLEDKAGFDPLSDWTLLGTALAKYPILHRK